MADKIFTKPHFFRVFDQVNFGIIQALSPAWKYSILAFFAGRFYYTFLGLIVWYFNLRPLYADVFYYDIVPVLEGLQGAFLGVWQRWDGIHYQRIATNGYTTDHVSLFYPLYPLLGRWLSEATGLDVLFTLQCISNFALLLSMVLIYDIVFENFGANIAKSVLFTIVIFPSGFYFYAIFPQSLLLLLILLSYSFVRKGKWGLALVSGFLAGLTHSTSVALCILIGIQAIEFLWLKVVDFHNKRLILSWNSIFALAAPFASLAGTFSFFSWREAHGFTPFITLQNQAYARVISFPWDGLMEIIKFAVHPPKGVNLIVSYAAILIFGLLIFFSVRYFNRIPWTWWFMQVGFLIFITTNLTVGNPLIGFFRYIIIIFPLYVEIALIGQSPKWNLVKFALGMFLSFFYCSMLLTWQFDL